MRKAQPLLDGDPELEDVHIVVGGLGEFPHCDDMATADSIRGQDAERILGALKSSLPGGTLDRLCVLMMIDRASELIVSREAVAMRDAIALERSSSDPVPALPADDDESGEFMTWRSLHRRLDELARSEDAQVRDALDREVVVRIDEDGLVACCGGLSRVDVEVGVGEEPALVLDGTARLLCDDLVHFASGQLVSVREVQFRRHLSGCMTCQDVLVEQMQMLARMGNPGPSAGLREDHRAFLSAFVRAEERSLDPVRRMRGVVVGAALSAATNGPRLVVDLARPLVALHQEWEGDPDAPIYADSLDALMKHLGLAFDGFWERRHYPVLANTEAFPGVQIVGCSCDWRVPVDAPDRAEAFELHTARAWDDQIDAAHAGCESCGTSAVAASGPAQGSE